jgi:hypothetical protein
MGCGLCFWSSEESKTDNGKRLKKNLLLPCFACAGKKENSAVQNDIVSVFFPFFFFKERKMNLGVTQKWVMTVAPSL